MPFENEPLGQVALKRTTSTFEKILLALMLLVAFLLFMNFRTLKDVQTTQLGGVQRGYINRAVVCDQARAIGASEPKHCDDSAIKPYRDPTIEVGSTAGAKASKKNLAVFCAVLSELKAPESVQTICTDG